MRKEEDERRMGMLSLSRSRKVIAIFAIAMRDAQHRGFGEGVEWLSMSVLSSSFLPKPDWLNLSCLFEDEGTRADKT